MQFGRAVGEACASFAVTNIDDMFVLVTFYAEASTSRVLTPTKIVIGQYLGFTVIIAISMIGFAASLVLPSEPIGFLGLLPILLGIWKLCEIFTPKDDETDEIATTASMRMRGIFKVALVTLMNGGDNIGTYTPLFAQAQQAEIAIYVVVYYILLGVWCLVAFLVMRQRHVLAMIQKYVEYFLPLLYTGLGIFVIVKSKCYPWAIEQIDDSTGQSPGQGAMAGATTFVLLVAICGMAWLTVAKRRNQMQPDIDLTRTDAVPATPEPSAGLSGGDSDVHIELETTTKN